MWQWYKGFPGVTQPQNNIEKRLDLVADMDPPQHTQNTQQQSNWQLATPQRQALVQQPSIAPSAQQVQYAQQSTQIRQAGMTGAWIQMPVHQSTTTHTTTTTTTTSTTSAASQSAQGQWQQQQQR